MVFHPRQRRNQRFAPRHKNLALTGPDRVKGCLPIESRNRIIARRCLCNRLFERRKGRGLCCEQRQRQRRSRDRTQKTA